jgi:hypothetical protein
VKIRFLEKLDLHLLSASVKNTVWKHEKHGKQELGYNFGQWTKVAKSNFAPSSLKL